MQMRMELNPQLGGIEPTSTSESIVAPLTIEMVSSVPMILLYYKFYDLKTIFFPFDVRL